MGTLQKPLTQRLYDQLVDPRPSTFGLVSYPGDDVPPIIPAAPAQSQMPDDPPPLKEDFSATELVGRIARLPVRTPEETAERDRLTSELMPLCLAADELAARVRKARHTEDKAEWQQLRKQCRKQLKLVEALNWKERSADARLETAIEASRHASTALQAMHHAPLPAYATDQEIAEKQALIDQAKAELMEANREQHSAMTERQSAQRELKTAQEEMNRLGTAERRLRNSLSGKPYNDAEFGLEVKST
jgi:chromosome segregation ATPase